MEGIAFRAHHRVGYQTHELSGEGGILVPVDDMDTGERLETRYPGLRVVGTGTPPFRPLTAPEEEALRREIEALAPDVLWIGLSTPKQERWMAAHVGRLNAKVMIGVGAAFDMHAGLLRQAPRWMQRAGLEWLFRLCMEPRRLWRRYLRHNPRFIVRILFQLLGLRGREAD